MALGTMAVLAPTKSAAQFFPASIRPASITTAPVSCGADLVAARLRVSHPLGAAAFGTPLCLSDDVVRWVPTRALTGEERARLGRALVTLRQAPDGACRLAASTLRALDRRDRVSVWQAVDTAGGMVYYGATYVAADSTPIAVQFWAPAFSRSSDWIVGAAAHEAFHALHPDASESDAIAFGERCRDAARGPTIVADAGG